MTFFTDRKILGFSLFAILFTGVEIAYLVNLYLLMGGNNIYFDYASAFIIPALVIGELLIIIFERNKVVIGYFPYTIHLRDVGEFYALAGGFDPVTKNPNEGVLRILIRKKGSIGKHYLRSITFETRMRYCIEFKQEAEIGIAEIKEPRDANYLRYHEFVFEKTHLKETQLEYQFLVRRHDKNGVGTDGQSFVFKFVLEYEYNLLGLPFSSREEIDVPSRITTS